MVKVSGICLLGGEERVGRPHGAVGEGALGRPEGLHLGARAVMLVLPVDHPLVLTLELQRGLLEAFLRHPPDPLLRHLAQAVGVPARVVCRDLPLHLKK